MIAGWTLGAWMVVVGIPGLLTAFSIFYYIKGDKEIEEDLGGKRNE